MDSQQQRIVREELWRSVAWLGLGIVGWPSVVSTVSWLEPTVVTVFGLPVLTWALLTTALIGVRTVTAAELQAQTPTGLSATLLVGELLAGVGAVALVALGGYSPLWVTTAYVLATGGGVVWYWYVGLPALTAESTA